MTWTTNDEWEVICEVCGDKIPMGEEYYHTSGRFDDASGDEYNDHIICAECMEADGFITNPDERII